MKSKLLIGIIVFILLLSSCATNSPPPPERAYSSWDITYSEPIAQYGFIAKMDATETTQAKYFFDTGIDSKTRESCIEATETILSSRESTGAFPEIYVFSRDRYNFKAIRENRLYCPVQEWRSVEYIADVLCILYGATAHYGSVFGYANHLARSYTWKSYSGAFSMPSIQDILDLNRLCFEEAFVSPADAAIAKGIACDFADSYITKNGEQAFEQLLFSMQEATNALSYYYADKGLSYLPSAIQYCLGGKSYDYVVYSDYGTFYVLNDWVDIHAQYNPLISDGFLHTRYADTKAFFETTIKQMKQYQDLFQLADYDNTLDIVFTEPSGLEQNSYYHGAEHRIYLYNVDSLMHEYIHALTQPNGYSVKLWEAEGFARFFSYYYDLYGMAFLNQDYNTCPDTPELKYVHEYLATINRPIDIAQDYRELENIAVYSRSLIDPNANYVAGSSFVQYLVTRYGEKAVIDSIYGSGTALPKPYTELVKEWNAYIETNYKEYSKYK